MPLWGGTSCLGTRVLSTLAPSSQIPIHYSLTAQTPCNCRASFLVVPKLQTWTWIDFASKKGQPAWIHRKMSWCSLVLQTGKQSRDVNWPKSAQGGVALSAAAADALP